jgi:hypothetical protein
VAKEQDPTNHKVAEDRKFVIIQKKCKRWVMGYTQWMQQHADKHAKIINKLLQNNYTQEEIIAYFDFENMKEKEVDFCPLYAKNKKCHEIQELNCYLCACPNFRFHDNGIRKKENKIQYSYCSIDSKDGKEGVYGEKIHQDCTGCSIPHTKTYVKQHFDLNWKNIMSNCQEIEGL